MSNIDINLQRFLTPLPLKNGIVLPHRIMPGPMEGVMNPLFCKVLNEFEIFDYWITPFIHVSTAAPLLKTLKKKIKVYTESFNPENPVIVQILGSNPNVITETCKRLEDLGVNGVNFNFACPSKTVLKSGNGGAFLEKPDKMYEIITKVAEKCPKLSLSLKLRSGKNSPSEMNAFLPLLSTLPIDFIMLHYRTVDEMYKKVNNRNLRFKNAVHLAANIPIIASGDIFSPENAYDIHKNTHCAGVAVARGLLKNPFLPLDLKNNYKISESNYKDKCLRKFYNKMMQIGNENPKYASRYYFIEIARWFWGVKSPEFIKAINKK
jgi:tRNA-dihydrouridine synthase